MTANRKIKLNPLLREFFSHSDHHPNGWGIALIDGNNVSLEREPVRASDSLYLRNRLTAEIRASLLLAHIRKATVGDVCFDNSHPFTKRDESGRIWTLIHNGTIFEADELSPYRYRQTGTTDSERILLYIVDRINQKFYDDMNSFDVNDRMELLEQILRRLSPENKLNLLFTDGEYLYVHKNAPGTLYRKEERGCSVIATTPLEGQDGWEEVEDNRLLVYKDGVRVYTGAPHPYTYVEDPEKIKLLFMEYAAL